jgi:hypothetical protein
MSHLRAHNIDNSKGERKVMAELSNRSNVDLKVSSQSKRPSSADGPNKAGTDASLSRK